jgi:putative restriction endonuclease
LKAVFDTKAGSPYNDDVAVRYHFPNAKYLPLAAQCVGDWIVYREPRDGGGSLAYFAVARVVTIVPDAVDPSHSYAMMSDYLPLDSPVPFRTSGRYEEGVLRALPKASDVGVSLRGRSIRPLAPEDFASIVLKGLEQTLALRNAVRLELYREHVDEETRSLLVAEPEEKARRIEQVLVNRPIRDASFRRAVLQAYDDTCAVTGIRIINGGGKAEAQAAHIVPVAAGGCDIVQNGIALCGTAHWLFDRHLISIGEDWRLLVAHNRLPEEMRAMFRSREGELLLPRDARFLPAERFLAYHRERFATATH